MVSVELSGEMQKGWVLAIFCVYLCAIQIEGKTCSVKFGGCDKRNGLCWNTIIGTTPASFCTCKSGYNFRIPATRSGRCININECRTGLHSCDTVHGRCVDTIGSHRCVCRRGYVLDYTKTKCLQASKIRGQCRGQRHRCSHHDRRDWDRSDLVRFFTSFASDDEKVSKHRCSCEKGYELRNGCKYCQDVNECKRRTSLCDLKNGYCHNSNGGYYCSCKTGFVLGPCGFKCHRPSKRPSQCTSSIFTTYALVRGDSDGLNDEASKAVVLDYDTEKAAAAGKHIKAYQTLMNRDCTTEKSRTINYDVDRDRKADVRVTYVCMNKKWSVKAVFDFQAYWTPWTCWTSCRPTCHGGIQTRTRVCKHGLVSEGKCKGPATKYKSCYAGRRCKLRVRRNAATLTKTQQNDLRQAMRKYKKDTSTFGFFNAAGTHVFPFQCMGATGNHDGCCNHGARLNFIVWHRAELLNFEEGLTRHLKDKTLGLPYWDWLKQPEPPAFIWNKRFNGKENPFTSGICRYDTTPPIKTQRTTRVDPKLVASSKNSYLTIVRRLMQPHTMHEFTEALENSHNNIHGSICNALEGKCVYSMASLLYAAFDPIFMMHHANVDRLFANFQQFMISRNELAWTRQSVLEAQENILDFNKHIDPFRNQTLTPFKRVNSLSTIENLFFYRRMLGYRYDTLKVPKVITTTAGDTERAHVGLAYHALYLAQFEKSIQTNVKITYYFTDKVTGIADLKACSKLDQSDPRYIGNATILGSKYERPWRSRQATIVPVSRPFAGALGWRLRAVGLSAQSNLHIKCCYTHSISCYKNCKQVSTKVKRQIALPQLLFYPRDIRQEVFKFEWDSTKRFPRWQIDIDSGTQWVQFWGKEAANIVKVSSRAKFRSCNNLRAKKVTCTSPCILQSGVHYFVHKNAAKCRKGMKLNILATL